MSMTLSNLNFLNRRKLDKLRLSKKVFEVQAPEYPTTNLDCTQHRYMTRSKTLFRLPRSKTIQYEKNILLVHLYNKLILTLILMTLLTRRKACNFKSRAQNYGVDYLRVCNCKVF